MADTTDVQLTDEVWAQVQEMADHTYSGKAGDKLDDHYELGDELGRGRFSVVLLATNKTSGTKFAVKVVENTELEEPENLEALKTEVEILRQLNHRNIVTLKEVVTTSDNTYIVMELLAGGELFNRIVEEGSFKEDVAKGLFAKCVAALEHLHSQNIVHRDIKPENILFTAEGSYDIKLIDFGYAGKWTPEEELDGLCGTPDYVAPEILTWYEEEDEEGNVIEPNGVKYGKSSDLWSMGVLLYVLLSGCSPFNAEEEAELLDKVRRAEYSFPDDEWKDISEDAKALIRGLLTKEPDKRFSLSQTKSHPWAKKEIEEEMKAAAKARAASAGTTKSNAGGGGKGCGCVVM